MGETILPTAQCQILVNPNNSVVFLMLKDNICQLLAKKGKNQANTVVCFLS